MSRRSEPSARRPAFDFLTRPRSDASTTVPSSRRTRQTPPVPLRTTPCSAPWTTPRRCAASFRAPFEPRRRRLVAHRVPPPPRRRAAARARRSAHAARRAPRRAERADDGARVLLRVGLGEEVRLEVAARRRARRCGPLHEEQVRAPRPLRVARSARSRSRRCTRARRSPRTPPAARAPPRSRRWCWRRHGCDRRGDAGRACGRARVSVGAAALRG